MTSVVIPNEKEPAPTISGRKSLPERKESAQKIYKIMSESAHVCVIRTRRWRFVFFKRRSIFQKGGRPRQITGMPTSVTWAWPCHGLTVTLRLHRKHVRLLPNGEGFVAIVPRTAIRYRLGGICYYPKNERYSNAAGTLAVFQVYYDPEEAVRQSAFEVARIVVD